MPRLTKLLLLALIVLIVIAHVGLWRNPEMSFEAKRNWTAFNSLVWGIIILPLFAVNQWLKAKTARPKGNTPDEPSP